ncbi:hypothetical protein DMN91_009808 [Ooceraea biroi]|uniref:Uncharacterized protein n=1 Tax=Ooceraea biroi TaxID=2015173 RepID=A0A3L8DBR3_OOCBI|nr:hypothetical protein DMN91_009808 [Ooceraea biroi]
MVLDVFVRADLTAVAAVVRERGWSRPAEKSEPLLPKHVLEWLSTGSPVLSSDDGEGHRNIRVSLKSSWFFYAGEALMCFAGPLQDPWGKKSNTESSSSCALHGLSRISIRALLVAVRHTEPSIIEKRHVYA